LNFLFAIVLGDTTAEVVKHRDALRDLKAKLNWERDTFAEAIFDAAFDLVKAHAMEKMDQAVHDWLSCKWEKKNRPKNVAIIIDEAVDLDFAEGLVSISRNLITKKRHLAQERVMLILAGVNLDSIKEIGRIGTDPSYSRLITMGEPQIEQLSRSDQLGSESEEITWALEHGTFAKILKTNARMFFRSVLPILQHPYHYMEDKQLGPAEKRIRLQTRLSDVASVRVIMDHAPRMYVNENSIGALEIVRRSFLLEQSFAYFMHEALGGIRGVHDSANKLCNELESLKCYHELYSQPTNNIFSSGIASKKGTSRALKYLACFGLVCKLRPAFGDEFEELTACHLMRYKQLLGYATHRYCFIHAWPPKRNKNGILEQLESTLEAQAPSEKDSLLSFFGGIWNKEDQHELGKHCIIFSQGTPTAQGGDVLALNVDFDTKTANLETIQCKHYKSLPSSKTWLHWWKSLGVALEENGSANLAPKGAGCSAAYSYEGLLRCCDLLQKVLEEIPLSAALHINIGTRILAVSARAPGNLKNIVIPQSPQTQVWFREMFEPTISVLPPRHALS
jgi:hypothetical protein